MTVQKLKLIRQVSQLDVRSDNIPINEAIAFLQSAKGQGATHFCNDIINLTLEAFEARPMTEEEMEQERLHIIERNHQFDHGCPPWEM